MERRLFNGCLLFIILISSSLCSNQSIPRRIVAFWDSKVDIIVENSLIHRTLEMPLNYLGLDVVYYDIQKPLPELSSDDEVRGILLCFQSKTAMCEPNAFIDWAIRALDQGKKVVLMGNPGFLSDNTGLYTPDSQQNRLYERLGFIKSQKWVDYPFEYQIVSQDEALLSFEADYQHPLPGFYQTRAKAGVGKARLTVGLPNEPASQSDLIITSPHGAYVSPFYDSNYGQPGYDSRAIHWYINPFYFFKEVFALKGLPIPDPTTLAGKRIFFATCHGDSWNIPTAIPKYKKNKLSCAEVILEEVIKPYPELPIAVGIIAADLDLKWVGTLKSQEVARHYLALPQVEAASHTYSHPFDWRFFEFGGAAKEINFLHLYPYGSWQNSFLSWFHARFYKTEKLSWGYVIPRAYANYPFNLEKEIGGSIDFVNQFAPDSNKIKLLIWPGDSLPWREPVALCEKAHVNNFGGGTVRFDADYPSNLFVYPFGRKPGGIIQLYAASSADNSYTYGWTDRFFGYRFLPITLQNTESPRRLKPIHLYYHSYSGEFEQSLNAILSNIAYIKTQDPIAITTGRYCAIGAGFYSVTFEQLSEGRFLIRNRKGLQTIRFDEATSVDMTASVGVVGYKKHQGSLYVYLDAAVVEPIIALGESADESFLIESSWEIWDLQKSDEELTFKAKGWGPLVMRWHKPCGDCTVRHDLPCNQEIPLRIAQ